MALPLLSAAGKILASRGAFFFYGAVAGPIVSKAAEPVTQIGRSLLKSGIRGALLVGATVQNAVTGAKDSLSDVAAEVRADIAKADAPPPAENAAAAAPATPVPA